MSKKKAQAPKKEEEGNKIWVTTEWVDDSYALTLSDDAVGHIATFNPQSAREYAGEILRQVSYATYDAAVAKQYASMSPTDPKFTMEAIAEVILMTRATRPASMLTDRLVLEPGVNPNWKPFLTVVLDGEPVGQWEPDDARDHALHILEGVYAAMNDNDYYGVLTKRIGLDETTAHATISDLASQR